MSRTRKWIDENPYPVNAHTRYDSDAGYRTDDKNSMHWDSRQPTEKSLTALPNTTPNVLRDSPADLTGTQY